VLRLREAPRDEPDIEIEPGGRYQVPDPELGFRPIPGSFRARFGNDYEWRLTNLPDSTRITRPLEQYAGAAPRPGIWVFGCSFVQGWGLDDDDTLPWKLQERFPDYDVVNFGVGGYGTLQSLRQFRRALGGRPKPLVAVLVYADFHDERNVRTTGWRDANISYERFGTTAQPYARLDGSGGLLFGWDDGSVPWLGLRSRSVLFNRVVVAYGKALDARLRAHEVSGRLIEAFREESRRHGVEFVLAGIWPTDLTRATIRRFADLGVPAVDISVDRSDARNRIPDDGHPTGFANDQHAAALATVETFRILRSTNRGRSQ
jgi:hypothetical protein